MTIIRHSTRAQWLSWRLAHLKDYCGASEAAVWAGVSPFQTKQDLFMIKRGLKPAEDISEKERVQYGSEAEQHITALFALRFRHLFMMETHPYDILLDDRYPFIGATLDGYLTYHASEPWEVVSPTGYRGIIKPGEKGIYEGKTSLLQRKGDMENWNDEIPVYYFAQGCQQLYVCCEWARYWIINAEVEIPRQHKDENGDWINDPINSKTETVRYVFFMDDPFVRKSIKNTVSHVVKGKHCVDSGQMPDMRIT